MSKGRSGIRGVVLCEDKRTERFVRHLLEELGFEKRKWDFRPAPSGKGAGEAWVLTQYPGEVKAQRAKASENRCLIAIRDGDRFGVRHRKEQLDAALKSCEMTLRQQEERIATPVPTWSIENWLLNLLDHPSIDESASSVDGQTWKHVFENMPGQEERTALMDAATAWKVGVGDRAELPSLVDGRTEIERLDG